MSNIKNIPTITDNYTCNVRRAAIEARGRWAAAFYLEAKEAGIDLEPIMRRAIRKIGIESGKKEREMLNVDPLTAERYAKYFVVEKSLSETFEKKIENISEDGNVADVSLNYCALLGVWQKMGLDDETCALMCDIAMEGDRGIAEGLGLDFELNGTLAQGCDYCALRYKTKK